MRSLRCDLAAPPVEEAPVAVAILVLLHLPGSGGCLLAPWSAVLLRAVVRRSCQGHIAAELLVRAKSISMRARTTRSTPPPVSSWGMRLGARGVPVLRGSLAGNAIVFGHRHRRCRPRHPLRPEGGGGGGAEAGGEGGSAAAESDGGELFAVGHSSRENEDRGAGGRAGRPRCLRVFLRSQEEEKEK